MIIRDIAVVSQLYTRARYAPNKNFSDVIMGPKRLPGPLKHINNINSNFKKKIF